MSAPNVPESSATHGAARPGGTARLDAEIRTLALPAFATLVAEPLLVIADSAIVGHISTEALAGLGVAASVIGLVIGLCIFLAYTTTASVARRLGAGDLRSALASGLDGISLALVVGVVLAVAISSLSPQIIGLYQAAPGVSSQAQTYLRVMAAGLPAVLVMLAATGVLRGLQDTRTPLAVALVMNLVNVALSLMLVFGLGWGIAGAATGSVLSQYAAAAVLAWTVLRGSRRHGLRWHPNPTGVLVVARNGAWLVVRTAGLQGCLLATTAVAARMPATAMAGHQILNSLWMLLVYAMDAVAIAAQAIVGRYLGAGDSATVRALLRRMLAWGVGIGVGSGVLLWAGASLYLPWFTPDAAVRSQVSQVLPVLALLTVVAGLVFVLDGVLIGAGDARYLAWASLINLVTYLPLAFAVAATGAGLGWLWLAYGGLTVSRLATLGLRARGTRWMRLGG